uniref:Uncharacterized protein n=1 Tax=Rhizophora mucronata TaxID=61149 RepID=A0A2P2PQA7_RHIMU
MYQNLTVVTFFLQFHWKSWPLWLLALLSMP